MKHLILSLLFISPVYANAQGWLGNTPNSMIGLNSSSSVSPLSVGIGTTSPTATLHTVGNIRFQSLPTGSSNDYLTVDANGNVSINSSPGGANAWLLTGNAGTTPGTNFLGTTDNNRLVFKTNNTEGATLLTNTNFGIGIGSTQHNTAYKLHVHNNSNDAGIAVTGQAPAITLSNLATVHPTHTSNGKIGYSTVNSDFATSARPNDLVIENTSDIRNIIFATNHVNPGGPNFNSIERLKLTASGRLGLNLLKGNALGTPTTVTDIFHVNLETTLADNNTVQEWIRFENMDTQPGTIVVIDNDGRLHKTETGSDELVEMIQETTVLRAEVNILKAEIAELKAMLNDNKSSDVVKDDGKSYLGQSSPNPNNGRAEISYYVHKMDATAGIKIYDLNGREVVYYPISSAGSGQVTTEYDHLVSGTYLYSLFVDGNKVDTKRMTIVR